MKRNADDNGNSSAHHGNWKSFQEQPKSATASIPKSVTASIPNFQTQYYRHQFNVASYPLENGLNSSHYVPFQSSGYPQWSTNPFFSPADVVARSKRSVLEPTTGNITSKSKTHRLGAPNDSQKGSKTADECIQKYGLSFEPGASKLHDYRDRFVLDQDIPYSETLSEAISKMEESYGGYCCSDKVLEQECNKKSKDSGHQVHCRTHKCRMNSDKNCSKCRVRVQIREYQQATTDGKSLFFVFKHRFFYSHDHQVFDEPDDQSLVRGIDPRLRTIVESSIAHKLRTATSILEVTPSTTLNATISELRRDKFAKHLREQLEDDTVRDHFYTQIRNLLKKRKNAYLSKTIGGYATNLATNDILIRVLDHWKLELPVTYRVSCNYQSASQLAAAMNMEEDQLILVNLTTGELYERFKSIGIDQTPATTKHFEKRMENSFIAFSPSGLFQLLTFCQRRSGTKLLGGDGSGGFCSNGPTLIPVGAVAVRYVNDSNPEVKAQLRMFAYFLLGGERFYPYLLGLYHLRWLAMKLFGVHFDIDWGASDHSDAFFSAHRFFKPYPTLLDATSPVPDNAFSKTIHPGPPQVTQTQEPNDTPRLEDYHIYADEFLKADNGESTVEFPEVEAGLNCYFHVMQNFSKPYTSFVKDFKDKTLIDTELLSDEECPLGGIVYLQVKAIHHCKSLAQRKTVTALILRQWREIYGENAAADKFESQYCVWPYWNWNYSCSGEVGVHPTNCPHESMNRKMKTDITLNVSLPRLLCDTLPGILRNDANTRSGPCTIQAPNHPSITSQGVSAFLELGRDIIELGEDCVEDDDEVEGYLCCLKHRIGTQLLDGELSNIRDSLDGLSLPFENRYLYDTHEPWDIADRMVKCTRYVCHITKNEDGIWVGDCEDCFKRLGRNCPGAAWVRSKYGQLCDTVENLRKVNPNAKGKPSKALRKGNRSKSYQSGNGGGNKPKCVPDMLRDVPSYLKVLNRKQCLDLISNMCLFPWQGSAELQEECVSEYSDADLLDELLDFLDDPPMYRDNH